MNRNSLAQITYLQTTEGGIRYLWRLLGTLENLKAKKIIFAFIFIISEISHNLLYILII